MVTRLFCFIRIAVSSRVFRRLPSARLFFHYTIPSVVAVTFNTLCRVTSNLFINQFVNKSTLTTIGLVVPVVVVIFKFTGLVTAKTSIHVTMLLNRGGERRTSHIFAFALGIVFIVSYLLNILNLLFTRSFIEFLTPKTARRTVRCKVACAHICTTFTPLVLVCRTASGCLHIYNGRGVSV